MKDDGKKLSELPADEPHNLKNFDLTNCPDEWIQKHFYPRREIDVLHDDPVCYASLNPPPKNNIGLYSKLGDGYVCLPTRHHITSNSSVDLQEVDSGNGYYYNLSYRTTPLQAAVRHGNLLGEHAREFKILAKYAKQCEDTAPEYPEFTQEVKDALRGVMVDLYERGTTFYDHNGGIKDFINGDQYSVTPEFYARLINPLHCVGDDPTHTGVVAAIFDIGRYYKKLAHNHYNKHKSQRDITNFYEDHQDLPFREVARLLGIAGQRWGLDKVELEEGERVNNEVQEIANKARRYFLTLFVDKILTCIEDEAQGKAFHRMTATADEEEAILDYKSWINKWSGGQLTEIEKQMVEKTERIKNDPDGPMYSAFVAMGTRKERYPIHDYKVNDEPNFARRILGHNNGEWWDEIHNTKGR